MLLWHQDGVAETHETRIGESTKGSDKIDHNRSHFFFLPMLLLRRFFDAPFPFLGDSFFSDISPFNDVGMEKSQLEKNLASSPSMSKSEVGGWNASAGSVLLRELNEISNSWNTTKHRIRNI